MFLVAVAAPGMHHKHQVDSGKLSVWDSLDFCRHHRPWSHRVEGNSVRQSDIFGQQCHILRRRLSDNKRCQLTGRPLISDPCRRSLARSAARRSYYNTRILIQPSRKHLGTSCRTHISHKHHAASRDEIKKCLDFPMLFKLPTHIVTIGFILQVRNV
jgi:hypothetical protein